MRPGNGTRSNMNPKLSLFLPVYNEEENLDRLNEKIFEAMAKLEHSFEVIYVATAAATTAWNC